MPGPLSRRTFALAACALPAGCARAAGGRTPNDAAGAARALDALAADYQKPLAPGASVVVVREGEVLLSRAYGLANVEAREPASAETNYRLASLTKQFTATAVMLLVADGRLRYDDRAVDVLDGLPGYARDVRVRHLLNHTSGVYDYEAFVADDRAGQVSDREVLSLVAGAGRLYFEPGSAVRYSNSGYALLSLVVERASGMRFSAFLRERVFAPLAMHATLAHEAGVSTVPRRAYGYVVDGAGVRPRDQSPTSAVLGDGGVYSSAADLALWHRALERHALLDEAAQREAFTPAVLSNGAPARYGFGWFVDDDGGRVRLTHHGETCGFTNAVVRYPSQRLAVVVLTNRAGGEPWRIAQAVADRFLGLPNAGPRVAAARPWPFESTPNAR